MTFDDHISVVPVDHGSHVPVLAKYAALAGRGQTILEFGCGVWSTPMLESVCYAREAFLASYETDGAWAERYDETRRVSRYPAPAADDCVYLVFIDCNPPEERMRLLLAWQDHADLIICHDANRAIYKWDFSSFKYKRIYKTGAFHTAVLSMEYEV